MVRIVSATELRTRAADIVEGLKAGDSYIIQKYEQVVGYITGEVPEALLDQLGLTQARPRPEFRTVKGGEECGES
ncbi:MAG: hypothetical protein ACYC3G_00680 [Minisyncoccota bacterium]